MVMAQHQRRFQIYSGSSIGIVKIVAQNNSYMPNVDKQLVKDYFLHEETKGKTELFSS